MSNFPPPPQRKRDVEFCKVLFGAVLSQVLYARRSFAPSMFQVIPLQDLTFTATAQFENIIATGSRVDRWDKELLRDQDNVLFLRSDASNYDLNHFLAILRTDIFPLLEREQLVKFRVSFLSSPTLSEESLVEYYTFVIKYRPKGRYVIDVWRAGTGKQHISTTNFKLWNLGDYLSRLPPLTEPVYFTLAFHASQRPGESAIGMWGFDRSQFEDAKIRLQQSDGFSYQRIANLGINALPRAACNLEANVARGKNEDERQTAEATNAGAEEPLADDRPPDEYDSEAGESSLQEEDLPAEDAMPEESIPEESAPEESISGDATPEDAPPKNSALGENTSNNAPLKTRVYSLRAPRDAPPPRLEEAQSQETPAMPSPPPSKAAKAGEKKAPSPKPRAQPKPKTKPKPKPKRKTETKPKPKPKPKANAKANATKSQGQKNGKANPKGKGKSPAAKSPEEADDVRSSDKKIATKRKPKAPLQLDPAPRLQIYEDVNSNMTETQPAARLSQLKSQNTQPGTHKRNRDDEVPTNSRTKRLKSSPQQFSILSSVGNPRSDSYTQSRGGGSVEDALMPDLDDNKPVAGGLFDVGLGSGGPHRPAKAAARKPSMFDSCNGGEDEDDDDEYAEDEDDEAVGTLHPRAMLGAPKSGQDSRHEARAGMEERSGEPVVGAQLLFSGMVASDDEED